MIEVMKNLPDNVIGFTAKGKVTGNDYETQLIPVVESKLKDNKKVRLLYHLGKDFDGFEAGAMWDDARVGLKHITAWEKIAVVTDVDWIRNSAKVMGFMMPGHVKVFKDQELHEAEDWIQT